MKLAICALFVIAALGYGFAGFAELADPQGRGGKAFVSLAVCAVALAACAVGVWFV